MQKALEEVALYNYKQRETVPRHHAKAQLISWAGQHIGTAGTSSIQQIHHISSPFILQMAAHLLFFNVRYAISPIPSFQESIL